MDAVLLAAGKGTRLRPLTVTRPKPLVPVANRPIMDYQIMLLERAGFDRVHLPVGYLGEQIVDYVGALESDMSFEFTFDSISHGTAGAVGRFRDRLKETFLVISGDLLVDVDLTDMMDFHAGLDASVTIALTKVEDPTHYGVAMLNGTRIAEFVEKPDASNVFSNVINAGIYVLEPEVLSHIPADGQCDFSMDLFPAIMKNLFLGGYLLPGYWNDIGRPSNYLQANGDALVGRFPLAKYLGDLEPFRGGSPIVGKRSSIGDVDISCPVLLGENCRIEEGSALRSFVVLGDDVTIGKDCVLEGVVVHNGTRIDASADLRKCIIGRGCEIGPDVELAEGTVIGDGTRIGESCRIGANMKIWAGSTLGPHTMIVPD